MGYASSTVSITVNPVNDAPIAVDDYATTDEDNAVTINVLGNDTDVDHDSLSVTGVSSAGHGTVFTNGSSVTYTPDADWNGVDSFGYTISDGHGESASALVTVVVNPVDDPGSVGDRVWHDDNWNGIQDVNELGYAGITVELVDSKGAIVAVKSTDAQGFYSFAGLVSTEQYRLHFVNPDPTNLEFSPTGKASDALDSDANAQGYTPQFLVPANAFVQVKDAGLKEKPRIIITGSDGLVVSPDKGLKVAKWHDAFKSNSDNTGVLVEIPRLNSNWDFIDRDTDRFNVYVYDCNRSRPCAMVG